MNKYDYITGGRLNGYIVPKIRPMPELPKPPLIRMIKEGTVGSCPNCGSSEIKKYWLFGPTKCINLDCLLSTNWNIKRTDWTGPR